MQIHPVPFLNCLCGSELGNSLRPSPSHFLNCLCGSESTLPTQTIPHPYFTKVVSSFTGPSFYGHFRSSIHWLVKPWQAMGLYPKIRLSAAILLFRATCSPPRWQSRGWLTVIMNFCGRNISFSSDLSEIPTGSTVPCRKRAASCNAGGSLYFPSPQTTQKTPWNSQSGHAAGLWDFRKFFYGVVSRLMEKRSWEGWRPCFPWMCAGRTWWPPFRAPRFSVYRVAIGQAVSQGLSQRARGKSIIR